MSDHAEVLFSSFRCKGHILGQMKVPILLESQVRLTGTHQLHTLLHELDGDVRRVEVIHVTDQGILVTIFSRKMGVQLNLGWSYSQMKRREESVRVFRTFQCTKLCLNEQISLGLQQKNRI